MGEPLRPEAHIPFLLHQPPVAVAICASAAVAFAAWALKALTVGGATSAFAVGCIVFGIGGPAFAIPLLVFLATGTILSRIGKANVCNAGKGPRRARQVWANGGVAAALVVLFAAKAHEWPWYRSRELLMLYLAALATVTADTWSTEVGRLLGGVPRLLTSWRKVAPGVSGAVSTPGTLAGLVGAALIPAGVAFVWRLQPGEILVVVWAGFLGSMADSILGAGLQAQYAGEDDYAPRDGPAAAGQKPVHGFRPVTNDVVNLAASLAGAAMAWLLLATTHYPWG
ncbi:MAG: DUF92 domain-containing protein [Armatimonadetes bacterium]|nr:DUF92 domain-containing protein [Armatimonadota bacterium]MDE2205924.1 DUF92 domain-containing protein [Armatimonadota bacterium]